MLDDGQEVRAFQAGDSEAFERLVDRYQRPILRFCQRLLGPGEDAHDLFQDVFLQAFRALEGLRDPGAFRTWLFRIAVRRARRVRRAVLRTKQEPPELTAPEQADPLERRERLDAMRRELAQLPPRQREVIELRHDQGLSYAEIAAILDIQEDAARASHYQGLRRLRRVLRDGEME